MDLGTLSKSFQDPLFHAQISAVRALSASASKERNTTLTAFIADDSRAMVARVFAVLMLREVGARELKDEITICDEWIDKLGRAFADIQDDQQFRQVVLAAAAFLFGHEVGHALIDQYEFGFTGREEDVADQFAVYLLAGTPTGAQQVLAGADAFGRFASQGGGGIAWDTHSFDEVRYFNILCWSYGSNPGAYPVVLTHGHLPLRRAQRCPGEYRKMAAGFEQLLQSHRQVETPSLSPKKPILTRMK